MKINKGRIINDFIDPNNRQYANPMYQHNYEWPKEQCVKLSEVMCRHIKRTELISAALSYMPL